MTLFYLAVQLFDRIADRGDLVGLIGSRVAVIRSGPTDIGSKTGQNEHKTDIRAARPPPILSGARAMFLSNIYVKF